VTGERLTVGPPFFNKWMAPIGLILLFLTGVGPLLAWRKSTIANLRDQFLIPIASGVVAGVAVVALGVRVWSSGLCFALSGFVLGTIAQEFWRGARVRQRATGTDIATALIGLVGRSRRRYGGYIVHVGIVLIFLGFAGEGFKQQEQAILKPGEQVSVGRFLVRHDGIRVTDDGQKQMVTADVTVLSEGATLGRLRPAKWFFRKFEEEPTTEVAIRRSFSEDLYVTLVGYDMQTQAATYEVTVNPLVNWIWAGFGIMAVGTILALLPESAFAFAAARVPAGAATTALLLVLLAPVPLGAQQHVENPLTVPTVPRTPLEKEMQRELVCICPTCGHKNLAECTCSTAARMRSELAEQVKLGKDRDGVRAWFVEHYGSQEPLGAPLDRGFNRLAWFFPYVVGGASLLGVGIVLSRWKKAEKGHAPSSGGGGAEKGTGPSSALSARLDDELRDLD
jgi:cytochrome c-type biogenesis protein CcmF